MLVTHVAKQVPLINEPAHDLENAQEALVLDTGDMAGDKSVTATEISPEEKRHVDETANLYRALSPSVPDRHAHFDIQLAGASDAVGNEASPVSLVVGCFIQN